MQQERLRDGVREWLEMLARKYKVSPRQIATRAGISPSTIYRALEEDGQFVMSTTKLAQVADAFGEDVPDFQADRAAKPAGFAEDELVRFEGSAAGLPDTPPHNQGFWTITNNALSLEGYRPGDIVVVDMGVEPQPGDVVCAQVYNFNRGTAETVLRVYAPPYLLVRTMDAGFDLKPLYVDNERVVIRGTVVRMVRERAA